MSLRREFQKKVSQSDWWKVKEKVLVAVSGGVDSIVLLHLLLDLPEEIKPNIYVAHINHQLREASEKEEAFVLRLCRDNQIPIFTTTWSKGMNITTNIEQEARDFRYNFFEEVMKKERINLLVTAHHLDDQVETVMMRLIGGSRLSSLSGIRERRSLAFGEVIRPLLQIKKTDLLSYSQENKLFYYEDESNLSLDYFRNRLRHKLIPEIEKENPKFGQHVERFSQELANNLSLLSELMLPSYQKCVKFSENSWKINRDNFLQCTSKEQQVIISYLIEDLSERAAVNLGFKQQELLYHNLINSKPNQYYSLKGDWYFKRNYNEVIILKEKPIEKAFQSFEVAKNTGVYLSETEWFGFFEDEEDKIPSDCLKWNKKVMSFYDTDCQQVIIRKHKAGDRLILNQKNQTKKISRYFIDEKIPTLKREKSWVVEDQESIVKWLVPFRESYLSIRDETDKIQYKLVYYYKDE